MNICKTVILAGFLMLPPWAAANAPHADETLTLAACLQNAALNNPGLKAAFEDWTAALEQIPQAKALDDPVLTYSYFIEEVETRVGPMEQKLSVMQKFPWFGVLQGREDRASANANAAWQRYEAAKLNLFYDVKKTYYEYSYLHKAIDIAQENLELVTHFEEVARSKYRTAAASHPDIIRAQVELAILEDVLTGLVDLKKPLTIQLNALMNLPAETPQPPPEPVEFTDVYFNHDNIVRLLIQKNPELAELDWKIQAAQETIELAKKRFYPNIGVGVDWTQIGPAVNPGVSGSGRDAVALMFSLNIPLWHDSYHAGRRQAQAQYRKTNLQKMNTENEKIAAAAELLYDIDQARREVRLYGQTLLAKAEELIQASETAYTSGTVDFLSLIDAQRMLLQYSLSHQRAIVNFQQSIAELEMLAGKQLAPGIFIGTQPQSIKKE